MNTNTKAKTKLKIEDEDGFTEISVEKKNTGRRQILHGNRSSYGQNMTYAEPITDSPTNSSQSNSDLIIENYMPSKKSTTKTKPDFNDNFTQNQDNYLHHQVTGKDTLQGLSLKYGVPIADLKRINRLWTKDDLFGRKQIIIPLTSEQLLQLKAEEAEKMKEQQEKIEAKQIETIKQFCEATGCEPDIAKFFLSQKSWNLTKALTVYHTQAGDDLKIFNEMTNGIKTSYESDEEILRRTGFQEKPILIERNAVDYTVHHALSGPAHLSRVNKKVQERFRHDDEEIFNL